jgi:superfamily I DNA/RNA helicase
VDPDHRGREVLLAHRDQGATEATAPERRLSLEALVRLGHEYAALDAAASVDGFTTWLSATVKADEGAAPSDAVEICTFHRAKGLEWPVVFVTGLDDLAAFNNLVKAAHRNDLLIANMNRCRTNRVRRHYRSPTNDQIDSRHE